MHCNKTDNCVISRSHLTLHGNSGLLSGARLQTEAVATVHSMTLALSNCCIILHVSNIELSRPIQSCVCKSVLTGWCRLYTIRLLSLLCRPAVSIIKVLLVASMICLRVRILPPPFKSKSNILSLMSKVPSMSHSSSTCKIEQLQLHHCPSNGIVQQQQHANAAVHCTNDQSCQVLVNAGVGHSESCHGCGGSE